ncbi:DUF2919 domain-containing protein [Vibrio albus]|uniref:DUF2919 domain-containing protein n=1 Tax=Vibrio albus TaxID=2200953 RepID=A0A2U3BD11_9VIBR|nr:DUF2919 domain-containing protein [Vibrio albus]PWI34689.1 DUF2919 domain-containing protein [Vibrio albus]
MRYPIEDYDKYGYLRAPVWLWLGWLFLARAWVVFVIAGVSRQSGEKMLGIVYPDHLALYVDLALGLPAIFLIWLIGLRRPERSLISKILRMGKAVSASIIIIQLNVVMYRIYLTSGRFHWPEAVTLVVLCWFLLFVLRSRRVTHCFKGLSLK